MLRQQPSYSTTHVKAVGTLLHFGVESAFYNEEKFYITV